MRIRIVFLSVVASLTVLTSSIRPQVTPSSATVYFYRLRDGYASVLKPSIYADKVEVARMRNGRYIQTTLLPGSHTITSTFPGNGVALDFKPGATYYIRVDMTRATFVHAARGEVNLVAAEQGKFEVSQLKPAEPEDTKTDPPVAKP